MSLKQLANELGREVGALLLQEGWARPERQELFHREFSCAVSSFGMRRFFPNVRAWPATGDTDNANAWAIDREIGLLGHSLLTAADRSNAPWIVNSPDDDKTCLRIIDQVMTLLASYYRDDCSAFIAVNECVADTPSGFRDCYYLRSMGPRYVRIAFELARQWLPGRPLILNETVNHTTDATQTRRWVNLMNTLCLLDHGRDRLVDVLGWQLHVTCRQVLDPGRFALAERMQEATERFGVANWITELDVAMEPGDTPEHQAEAYRRIVEIWREHGGDGSWLMFWGVTDAHSHLGPDAGAHLFDENLQPKPAYRAVAEALT